jgi:hypothetical protein
LPLAAAKRNLDAVSLCQIQLRASGENLANLTASFAIIDEMGFIAGGEQRDAADEMFRRTYWDTALAASDPVLRMRRDLAGTSQVLYATDFPYLLRDLAICSKQWILQSSELSDSERRAILGGNASRLFSRRFRASRNVIWLGSARSECTAYAARWPWGNQPPSDDGMAKRIGIGIDVTEHELLLRSSDGTRCAHLFASQGFASVMADFPRGILVPASHLRACCQVP